MNEHRSKGPGPRADGGETNPAQRLGDERAAAPSPDEATQRVEVRRFLNLLIATALVTMLVDGIASIAIGSPRWFGPVIVGGLFGAWLAAGPRRAVDHENVEAIVTRVAIVLIAWILAVALFQPFLALALAPAYLVPIAFALPYLEVGSFAWSWALRGQRPLAPCSYISSPTTHLPQPRSRHSWSWWSLTVVIGVVFIVLYRSAEGLKASSREFRRLFELSSDLAESTDPGVLGGLVARHLAEATGFDDCVIYALAPDSGRFAPFGSHPAERSLETDPESLAHAAHPRTRRPRSGADRHRRVRRSRRTRSNVTAFGPSVERPCCSCPSPPRSGPSESPS